MKNKKELFKPKMPDFTFNNAVVGSVFTNEWIYAHCYKEAANALVNIALEKHRMDVMFYPICYLYRHCIEITLKELIRDLNKLIEIKKSIGDIAFNDEKYKVNIKKLTNNHNLESLFNNLEQRLRLFSDESIPQNIRNTVLQLNNFDSNSQRFRYSKFKKKEVKLIKSFPDIEHINLNKIKDELGEAINFLQGGVGGWLHNYTSYFEDVLQDMKSLERNNY
ncbi:MAG: hypothetical protein H8D45_05865 [Bacteroidetes bacterium]|nr:hypothetical protein [Bacteroidota bacterium]